MVSPPSSLPSPTPSSSSHSHYQSLSLMQPNPPRVPSAASGISSHSREAKMYNQYPNGYNHYDQQIQTGYNDYNQQHSQPYNSNIPSAYLPPVTSSPPPHPPPYVPPPQHAMAPDPIHQIANGGAMGIAGPGQGPLSPTGMIGGNWPNGIGAVPNGWNGRGQSNNQGYPNQPHPQPIYPRSTLPNGSNPMDVYGGVGRSSISNSSISGLGPRPASGPGESRERRRDREREREKRDTTKDEDGGEEEVISTIFVVGFPDDMSEREFQNIFTFAPGFEAATLKLPSTRSREQTTLLAELTQLAALQAQAQSNGEVIEYPITQPVLEEAMLSLSMTTSTSTTPSAAISLTPSMINGPTFNNTNSNLPTPTRKQTIGFARFKTRSDALAAKDSLQGKKIDSITGATLKAEMAKKNLHTKKTTSGEELVGILIRSGKLSSNLVGNVNGTSGGTQIGPGQNIPNQIVTGGLPSSSSSSTIYGNSQSQQQQQPISREVWDSWPNQSSLNEREYSNLDDTAIPPPSIQNNSLYSPTDGHTQSIPSSQQQQPYSSSSSSYNYNNQTQPNSTTSPSLSIKSPSQRLITDSKALLALAEEADELEGWSVNGAVGIGIMDGYNHNQNNNKLNRGQDGNSGYTGPVAGVGVSSYGARNGDNTYGTSPPGGSDRLSENGRSLLSGNNPADQNPPINTLYVGNLPAISPPTHPPNFLEESLRGLFSRCAGFKRMSFRQKINGPMCFVEFEEVVYASQAIKDLYGHNLGGLVKGGIRLSYSKNSLGQRGNAHPSSLNTSMFGGIAHTVALAGMSMTSPTTTPAHPIPINGQNQGSVSAGPNPGYGLQLQHGLPQSGTQPPVTAPISETHRDSISNSINGNSALVQGQSSTTGISTSLSPTAQPFNISLPNNTNPTSPRSRYFQASTNKVPSPSELISSSFTSPTTSSAVPIPTPHSTSTSSTTAFQPFPSSNPSSGFSPMSSPIRTPASFSWKSSSGLPPSNGSSFGGFDFTTNNGPGTVLNSLNGAASAWGAGNGNGERRE